MKKGFTVREKVLLVILGIIVICALYYYLFYLPKMSEIEAYKQDNVLMEDQILVAQTQVAKMNKMEKELEELLKNDETSITSLPAYDNSRQIVNELYTILGRTKDYEVTFGQIFEEDGSNVVRRTVKVYFATSNYDVVKNILVMINDSQYRCLIKDVDINLVSGVYSVSVDITYFEYKE